MGSDWGAHYRLACRYFHSLEKNRTLDNISQSALMKLWSCLSELALACLPWIVLTLSSSFFLSKSFFCVFNHNISQCHDVLGLLVLNNTAWKHLFGPGDQQSHQDTSSENHKCFHAFFVDRSFLCRDISPGSTRRRVRWSPGVTPLGTMNVCTKFHGDPSFSRLD